MSTIILSGLTPDELLLRIEQIIDVKIGRPALPKTGEDAEYITRKEVASLLKVCLPTLHDYTKQNWLKAYKMGNRVLYKKHEVEAALSQVQFQKGKKGGVSW